MWKDLLAIGVIVLVLWASAFLGFLPVQWFWLFKIALIAFGLLFIIFLGMNPPSIHPTGSEATTDMDWNLTRRVGVIFLVSGIILIFLPV